MSSPFRKTVRSLHLCLGLTSGLVIFIVALTGAIYCFESELRALLHRELYEVPVTSPTKQSVSQLLKNVKTKFPQQQVKSVSLPSDPGKSVVFSFRNKTNLFLNPYTGVALGSLDMEKEFFAVVLKLHRSLLLDEPGKRIIGVSVLIFFMMIVSGLVLWWPRKNKKLGSALLIKKKAGPSRRIYDLHRVLGFYACWFLLISVLTGLIWNFKWAENSMYWLTGSKKEEKKARSVFQVSADAPCDKIVSVITARYPHSDILFFFPEDSVGVYRAVAEVDRKGLFIKRDSYSFDRYKGQLLDLRLSAFASAGEKVKSANYNLHTGKAFGFLGQFLMFCAALIAASLPVTGFLIWRNRAWKSRSLSAVRKVEKAERNRTS